MPRGVPEKQAHPRWALRNTKSFKEKRKNEEALQRYPDAGFQPAGRVWHWLHGPGCQRCSAFAGNPYFIDLDQLAADGLLKPEDYAKENWGTNPNYCDYALLYQKRYKVLRKAYAAFLQQRPVPGYDTPYSDDWYRFTFLSDAWLPDYCLYMAIKEENKMCDWQTWPAPLRLRDPKALEEFRIGHADELGFWAFVQYEFAKQWQALKAYANSKGIKIMGDIPIYMTGPTTSVPTMPGGCAACVMR